MCIHQSKLTKLYSKMDIFYYQYFNKVPFLKKKSECTISVKFSEVKNEEKLVLVGPSGGSALGQVSDLIL